MMLKIKSNRHWRTFLNRWDVPAEVLAGDLDWCTPEEDYLDGFFCYRGYWYHLGMFMRLPATPGWDAQHGDSFFSGVLIKLSSDGETYQVATYYS